MVMKSGQIYSDMSPREFFSDRERIQKAGLEMPPVIALREELNKRGVNIPTEVQTEEELIEVLCRLK